MDDDAPEENLCIFKDVLKCSVLTNYPKIIFLKLKKRKWFNVVADVKIAYKRQ